ncbi:hypothetical protein [Wolbachia endosymbiont of Culex quinquefasciatus]|uniref:hypothetical protein n=1 Tax=Wolbachia endosymbiont of Culex quinquefasciatus TaxID=263437 RepID=UPI0001762078|nr:hypothetical protein [Wolbachia endosymbiont of Culex quinquefasciatus]CAQ55338.1 hypothetical protein WP1230 [Wolbachia endosymbiont of Culex quinquefasciatus Pel]
MSNNIYSDQVNNSNLYANKLFYGEEGEQVENLGDQVAEKEDDKSEEDLLRDCRDETKKAKDKLIQCKKDAVESQREITKLEAEASELKSQVQEEREKVEQTKNEAEAKVDKLKLQVQEEREKVEQTKNEAEAKVDKLKLQVQEEREKVEQTKNEAKAEVDKLKLQVQEEREKVEQTKNEAEAAKEEVLRCKIEQEKEEVMQSKIEGVKEELLKCKINMAKAETEWYKKAAEECKNEKRIGTDKPSIKVGNENDRGKHVTNEGGNESGEITSREITPDLSLSGICGPHAHLYKSNNKIGYQGFNTSDLLKELYPEIYSNSKILPYIEKGSEGIYSAVNFKFAFTDTISSAANFGNTKCLKCIDSPQELACQDEKVKSFCQSGNDYANKELNKNFFSRESCPDLIKDPSAASIVKAKQVAPLILVNTSGQMIDKEGNNTQVQYNSLKPYLKLNGKIRDCGNDQKCKDYNAIMEKVAWDSDKEVLLKAVFDNVQRTTPYSYDNEVSSFPIDNELI